MNNPSRIAKNPLETKGTALRKKGAAFYKSMTLWISDNYQQTEYILTINRF